MAISSNKAVFSTVEFESWANKTRLIPAEKHLIELYLDKMGKTLEAGTAGGKILLAMKDMGFTSLHGFDYVPEFIEQAKRRDASNTISFEVGDAVCLEYEDSSFDQAVYLQQVICFIEDEASRMEALRESHRILKPGGTALFSFLSFEARSRSLEYIPFLFYLSTLRKITGSHRSIQQIPWLKLGGRMNFGALRDVGPYVYWYKLGEICQILKQIGFQIVAMGSTRQIREGRMRDCYDTLAKESIGGMLYVVCKK